MSRPIDQIPAHDRPREKLLARGAQVLSDQELLAVLLGSGNTSIDVMTLAEKLTAVIDEKGLSPRAEDLKQFGAVGDAKATLILAAIEFARRRIKPAGTKITTPADLLPLVRHYADRKQEHFLCVTINGANEVLNVRVISIVGRFLEHARIFAFTAGGETGYWIGSADMMARNLDNRVELVAPVDDPLACEEIQSLIDIQLRDTALAWELGPDAVWRRREPEPGQEPLNSQDALMEHASRQARSG